VDLIHLIQDRDKRLTFVQRPEPAKNTRKFVMNYVNISSEISGFYMVVHEDRPSEYDNLLLVIIFRLF
jgi:hypothetical protein